MMRYRNEIRIQFTDKKRGLGPKTCRDSFHQVVMVCITLFENVEKAISSIVDSFHPFVESQIVGVANGWNTENDSARIGIKR